MVLVLLKAVQGGDSHIHVIEDDAIFSKAAVSQFEGILDHADAQLTDWDMIFTDIHLPTEDLDLFRQIAGAMKQWRQNGSLSMLGLDLILFSCTSSVFINRRSLPKYAELIRDQWRQELPIDLFLRSLVHKGELKAYLTVPFLTSVSPDMMQSDIRGMLDKRRAVATIYRRSFFQDADLHQLDVEMRDLVNNVEVSPWTSLYIHSLIFRVSDQWKPL